MSTHPKAATAAAACLAFALPCPAMAQDSPSATLPRVEITGRAAQRLDEQPASTSRLGMSVRETPASVTIVDRADIDAMGARDTHDILAGIPGVSYSSQPGAPGSVSWRGFGSGSLSQLYNGITVQYDAIAARPVDAWLVERVEALGGPSSFLNGSGAVGGSINVITRIADLKGELTHGRVALGSTRQIALGLQRQNGPAGTPAQVLRLEANGTRGTHWAQGDDRRSWQLAVSLRQSLAERVSHTAALERQFERVDQPYWGTPLRRNAADAVEGVVSLDPRTVGVNYNVVDGRYQQDVTWFRSILQWQPTEALQATHTFYHYDALRDYENVETYTFVNGNTGVRRSNALLQRHDQQVWGSRAEVSHKTTLGGMKSDFAGGWDWSYNRQTRFPLSVAGPFDTTDPYAPAPTFFYQTPGIVPVYTPGATNQLRTLALFIENRTVLASGWALTSGLRRDRMALTVRNHRAVTATNPAVFDTGFKPVTGRLGLVHDVGHAAQAYVQYSTAADPPSGVLATAGFATLRDFDLTRGRQVEIGSKFGFHDGRGEARVALYDIQRKDLAITDPSDRTRVIPVGAQSSRGVELNASWRPIGAITLAGHFGWVDAEFDEFFETVGTTVVSRAGKTPANVPARVAGLAVTWKVLPSLALSLDGRHVGKRFANTANTVWEDAYNLLGLTTTWQAHDDVRVQLRVDNLTDRVHAATVGTNLAVLGAPRTAHLSADWRF